MGDELRRRRADHEHRADHEVRLLGQFLDRMLGRVDGLDRATELRRELAQPLRRAVDDGHVGAQAHGHLRGVGAGDAAAEDDDLGRGDARHAAEQHAEPAIGLLQRGRADLHRHAAGDLAHRRQQRQTAVRRGHGLVRDAGRAGCSERLRLRLVGGEVQVGEQHLALAQHAALGRLRLLDLDDQLGGVEDLLRGREDAGAGGLVLGVVHADAEAGLRLDRDLVSGGDELVHAGRRQPDAVFVDLDFLRDADAHRDSPWSCEAATLAERAPAGTCKRTAKIWLDCAIFCCFFLDLTQGSAECELDRYDRAILQRAAARGPHHQQPARRPRRACRSRRACGGCAHSRPSGLIEGYAAIINQQKAGRPRQRLRQHHARAPGTGADLAAFEQAVRKVPEVMECYLMSGEYDYLLRVVVADTADFERVHSRHLTSLPHVTRVHSSFALRTVQKSRELPVR